MGISLIGLPLPSAPQGNGPSKMTLKRIIQNQMPIDYEDENENYDYDRSNNFDAYDDANDQKPDN